MMAIIHRISRPSYQSENLLHALLPFTHFLEEDLLILFGIQICSDLVSLRLRLFIVTKHLIQAQEALGNLLSLYVLEVERLILCVSLVSQ